VRQAQKRTFQIEPGQGLILGDDLQRGKTGREQPHQRRLKAHDDLSARLDPGQIPAEVYRVAEALLGVDQQRPFGQRLALPAGRRKIVFVVAPSLRPKSVLVRVPSLGEAPGLQQRESKIHLRVGIIRPQAQRLAQRSFGILEAAAIAQKVAERVMRFGKIRLLRQGRAQGIFCLVEETEHNAGYTEAEQGGRGMRIVRERGTERIPCFLRAPKFVEYVAKLDARFGERRRQPQRLPRRGFGFMQATGCAQRSAETAEQNGIVGTTLQCSAEMVCGFAGASRGEQQLAEIAVRLGEVGAQAQRRAKAAFRRCRLAAIAQDGAEIVVGFGIGRTQAQRLAQMLFGFFRIAKLA
jgi:hypothetical protein